MKRATEPITNLCSDANNFKDSFMKAQKENEEIFNKAQEAEAPPS